MKHLQRALEVIGGVGLCYLFEPFDLIKGGIALFFALVIYLPVMAQFDGDSNGK